MDSKNKAFTKVAKYYDLVMQDFDYREMVDYLDDLIMDAGGDRTTILSIGCGTGEELLFFHQLGYTISGLDNSKEMIEVAKEKLPFMEIYCMDMVDFKLENRVDNIISTFDSINNILDDKSLERCFKSVYNSLNRGGLFLFDFNTVYTFIHDWKGVRTEEGEGYEMIYESEFNYNTMICDTLIKFFIEEEDKHIKFSELHREKGYTEETMKNLLKKVGFKVVKSVPFLKKKGVKTSEVSRYQIVAKKV
ncbi:MAG: hypothetical protein CR982_09855 [Candidatus Cloacimonadota bacterium]|nr:MAG: hypothetical protein CR982_09855 [Candidatus Cloacimonadota bacterium]PIE78210.1 MAG: hypothetical protein CSA15_09170 [Candidatus Delongbacteria bacterium]